MRVDNQALPFYNARRRIFSVIQRENQHPSESKYTQYVLQAGSFRASTDADRRRGELALLGLEAAVEEISTDTGSWHRVYIGLLRAGRQWPRHEAYRPKRYRHPTFKALTIASATRR